MSDPPAAKEARGEPDALFQLGGILRAHRSGDQIWRLALIDGPNMSNLGAGGRDRRNFGAIPSLAALHAGAVAFAEGLGVSLRTFQSNHEGAIVEFIYAAAPATDAFLFNPAGLSKYGVPSVQALADSARPVVELHFANTASLGWSEGAVMSRTATACAMGFRNHSYTAAIFGLVGTLDSDAAREAL